MNIQITPIGIVKSKLIKPQDAHFCCEDGLKSKNISEIIINEEFVEGLKGLEEFSHAFVIYHLNKADRIETITQPGPSSIKNLKKVGIFASRSQYRPNHLALRLTKIVKIKNNTISCQGLDAINNSKIYDIKPYISGFDRPDKYSMANWYYWMK